MKLSALTAGAVIGGRLSMFEKLSHAGNTGASVKTVSDKAVKAMVIDISYVTEVMSRPKRGGKMEFWVPLAKNGHGQEIIRTSIDAPGTYNINEETVYGNKMVYMGSGTQRDSQARCR